MAPMIKLYGKARSRASRSLWMLEELGVPYEHVPVLPGSESRAADYLRINPNGRIPSLDHDGFVLWESLAINLYLAERLASAPLWPRNVQQRGLVYQWSFWAANEVESLLGRLGRLLAKPAKQQLELASLLERMAAVLGVLDAKLEQDYLLGPAFTLADLNLASTLREPGEVGVASLAAIELSQVPRVARWLDRCEARPANRRVAALAGPSPAKPLDTGDPAGKLPA
jgi:glutathione S-transferase